MLSESEGKELVKLARQTIEDYFKEGKIIVRKTDFKEKRGVFVSIHTFPDHELRGCIGYPHPIFPLGEALQKASFSAAFHDTRFPPLTEPELKKVVFEVSVLTEPELIKVKNSKEYLEKIRIGRDGLIIEHGLNEGLLLPQVWKQIPDKEEFLVTLCWKAGLTPDYWRDDNTKIYRFRAQVFSETKPYGNIVEVSS